MLNNLKQKAIELLKVLIEIPSFSKEEDQTADALVFFLKQEGVNAQRIGNNVYAYHSVYDEHKVTILLNSHHDTVKPNAQYTHDPFKAIIKEDILYGLGSNDAGASVVSLLASFLYFKNRTDLKFNLLLVLSAEEEISGKNGIESVLPELGKIDFGIVGEPTEMKMAIAEKGLMVLDAVAKGMAGHAAREEGLNAISIALKDIEWFHTYQFSNVSDTLGEVKMTVTMIHAGTQHNVIPDTCTYTVDVRNTDAYTNEELLSIIKDHTCSEISPRSKRLNSSGISKNHVLLKAAEKLNIPMYGSPTLSDQALMHFPTVKIGPGNSARSHTANEYILLSEIENGIDTYLQLLNELNKLL